MEKLFISDLDGTLLNSNAELSEYTKAELNRLIENDVSISFATARTAATCLKMFSGVNLKLPIILMNGVCIYDISSECYINICHIIPDIRAMLVQTIKEYSLGGFLYSITENTLDVYYQSLDTPNAKAFIEERERKYGKVFTRVDDFTECIKFDIVYYSVSDKKEKLDAAYEYLKNNSNIHVEYYRDIYDTDSWYLEVCSDKASKFNAVKYLREKYDVKYIVGFGDNLNDIPLFKACDEKYGVMNAKEDVKKYADGIIDYNYNDGVVKKIAELIKLYKL